MRPDYLNDPGRAFEDTLYGFSQRAVGAVAPRFLKGIASASEVFFRKNMGERYFDSNSVGVGVFLWFFATLLSSFCGVLGAKILGVIGLGPLAKILDHGNLFSVFLGLLVITAFIGLAISEKSKASRRRNSPIPRHSMTRGESRIKDPGTEILTKIAASVVLLAFAMPLGCVLVLSLCFCRLLIIKQDEAIYSRYLDAIDSKIEAEQLETALLGNTPLENTYLYKPLDKDMPLDLRVNVAAAAGNSVVNVEERQTRSAAYRPRPRPKQVLANSQKPGVSSKISPKK